MNLPVACLKLSIGKELLCRKRTPLYNALAVCPFANENTHVGARPKPSVFLCIPSIGLDTTCNMKGILIKFIEFTTGGPVR